MTAHDQDVAVSQHLPKSKTQVKRDMEALQKIGLELVNLTQANLDNMPLVEELREAVDLARRINRKKDGFRRQVQFIGKLMRNLDTTPIRQALSQLKQSHQQANQAFHQLENLRDQIMQSDDQMLQTLLEQYPQLDRQKLRHLKRQASKQTDENKPPKAARELFQYLKQEMD